MHILLNWYKSLVYFLRELAGFYCNLTQTQHGRIHVVFFLILIYIVCNIKLKVSLKALNYNNWQLELEENVLTHCVFCTE